SVRREVSCPCGDGSPPASERIPDRDGGRMKSMNRCAWLLPLVFAASPALANSGHEPECEDVRARIIDAQVTDGCTSPNNFCAGGTVTGNRGLNGTTFFTLDGAVLGPASRPGSFSTSGVLVYTTSRGTLTVR